MFLKIFISWACKKLLSYRLCSSLWQEIEHKNLFELFFRSTSVKVCTGDYMGIPKCHNLKKTSFKNSGKSIYFFSPPSLLRRTFWHSFEWCFTFVFTTKTLVLRAIFRKHIFSKVGPEIIF